MHILHRGKILRTAGVFTGLLGGTLATWAAIEPPNIVLVMADDMGWAQTGYLNNRVLQTPNLDEMAAHGLRFDRFYAGAPVCSPTRATVLTGRTNDRTGVNDHGFPLRRQEKTLPRALQAAGYATAHFGKWHLNGVRGSGVPVLAEDDRHPGVFGFDEWLSATNYFDLNPILGSPHGLVELTGDSSDVAVAEALKFIARRRDAEKPSFTVIWYGSPHHPARAFEADMAGLGMLDRTSRNHYGELVALDRSVGTLRRGLRELEIAENTLVWFCSDNGGLKDIHPSPVGGLRDFKGSLYEGGLRVPAIIEWPAVIRTPRVTRYRACTTDIFPTIAQIVQLPDATMLHPLDGRSLRPLFFEALAVRAEPLGFRYMGGSAMIDGNFKIVSRLLAKTKFGAFELYDLEADPNEAHDLAATHPDLFQRMRRSLDQWNESVDASVAGKDYPEGRVNPSELVKPRSWKTAPEYQPYLPRLLRRPEYRRTAENLKANG